MAYTGKTDWKYDDVVTEQDLNRIEQGIEDSINTANQASVRAIEAENNSKAYTDQQIQLVTETGIPKLVTYPFVLTAEADEQTEFIIPLETFNKDTDTLLVVQNSTVLSTERFTVLEDKTIRLLEGVSTGTKIFVQVFKNVPLGPEGAINGGVIAVNSLPSDRVQGFEELFTSVSDGKAQLETAITDKDGKVSKQGEWATFDELDEGIRSIPQAKGNATSGQVLAGRTFSSETAGIEVVGIMENRGALNQTITTQNGQYIIPKGYHDGLGKVTAHFLNLIPTNIRQGIDIGGVVGNFSSDQPHGFREFTTSSLFTVPQGVSTIVVIAIGGGGSGGSGDSRPLQSYRGGGGGGGATRITSLTVTEGQSFTVTIGGSGGTTNFGGIITAPGGSSGGNGWYDSSQSWGGSGSGGSGGTGGIGGGILIAGQRGNSGDQLQGNGGHALALYGKGGNGTSTSTRSSGNSGYVIVLW